MIFGIGGSKPQYLLVGLGNIGQKYEQTRHNAGFMAIDRFCEKNSLSPNRLKFKAMTCPCTIAGKSVLILKPTTFMNLSGEAVSEAANFYKIPAENILVIQDDISLEVGKMRIRRKGSDGGQKGIRSIISSIGTDKFPRIKIGVGEKPPYFDLADWVLSKFSKDDLKSLDGVFDNCAKAIELIIDGKTDEAMNRFN